MTVVESVNPLAALLKPEAILSAEEPEELEVVAMTMGRPKGNSR